jgi:hypothetical protein
MARRASGAPRAQKATLDRTASARIKPFPKVIVAFIEAVIGVDAV